MYTGEGTARQKWISYRDGVVFYHVALRASLFPIYTLMLHGIVAGAVGQSRWMGLDKIDMQDFEEEVFSFFALTGMSELYVKRYHWSFFLSLSLSLSLFTHTHTHI